MITFKHFRQKCCSETCFSTFQNISRSIKSVISRLISWPFVDKLFRWESICVTWVILCTLCVCVCVHVCVCVCLRCCQVREESTDQNTRLSCVTVSPDNTKHMCVIVSIFPSTDSLPCFYAAARAHTHTHTHTHTYTHTHTHTRHCLFVPFNLWLQKCTHVRTTVLQFKWPEHSVEEHICWFEWRKFYCDSSSPDNFFFKFISRIWQKYPNN